MRAGRMRPSWLKLPRAESRERVLQLQLQLQNPAWNKDGAMSKKFVVGDSVTWTSQSGGYTVEKTGQVEQVVPAGGKPDRERFASLYTGAGVGITRDHESYVVRVKGRGVYWPRVVHLQAT